MTPRLPDWSRALEAYCRQLDGAPWEWGHSDCAMAAAGAVDAVTGVDVGADWRGRYGSALEARRAIRGRAICWGDIARRSFALHGWPEVDPRGSRVADIGLTADACFCVRMPSGFIARQQSSGRWGLVSGIARAWAIG